MMVNILDKIKKLANKYNTEIYLTGGAVRDIILGNEINDYDFAIKDDVEKISIEFSETISGTQLELDEKNKIYRVVKNNIDYDFTALRGDSIKKDLAKRDFTINAMAIHHHNFSKIKNANKKNNINQKIIFDPYQGIIDIKNSLIRVVKLKSFEDDPIRLLRGIRFKAILNFDIEKNTEKLIYKNRKLIKKTAPERIRYELIKIFESSNTTELVNYMEDRVEIFSVIFPAVKILKNNDYGFSSKINSWEHVLDMLNLNNEFFQKQVINYLPKKDNIAMLKFAIIFHEYNNIINNKKISKNNKRIEDIFRNLKFSNWEIKYINMIIKYHSKVFSLYNDKNLNDSKIYDFFEKVRDFAKDILFLAALDYVSIKRLEEDGNEASEFLHFINKLLNRYDIMIKAIKNPLLTGEEIIEVLNIREGPLVGEYLKKIKKQQALGKITTKSEAIFYLNNLNFTKDNNR